MLFAKLQLSLGFWYGKLAYEWIFLSPASQSQDILKASKY